MKVWHIRMRTFGVAFALPENNCHRLILFFRGWRPTLLNGKFWRKPSKNQKAAESGEDFKYWSDEND